MKKIIFVLLSSLLCVVMVHAQILAPKKAINLKIINPTATPIYSFTNASVSINTGTDNKEFPLFVHVWLYHKGKGVLCASPEIRNEMLINSTFEFGLTKRTNPFNTPCVCKQVGPITNS
jgi:hypothetical protein